MHTHGVDNVAECSKNTIATPPITFISFQLHEWV